MTMLSTPETPKLVPPIVSVAARETDSSHMATTHRLLARLLLGAVVLQVFFAGLGIFGLAQFTLHAVWGAVVILGSLSLPIVAVIGRLGRAIVLQSILLAGLMFFQGFLIDLGRLVSPYFLPFHPVNAMLLVLLLAYIGRPRHK